MKLSKKKQKAGLLVLIAVFTVFVSCSDANLITEPSKLVSEMTKSELLWGVFWATLITGIITS